MSDEKFGDIHDREDQRLQCCCGIRGHGDEEMDFSLFVPVAIIPALNVQPKGAAKKKRGTKFFLERLTSF